METSQAGNNKDKRKRIYHSDKMVERCQDEFFENKRLSKVRTYVCISRQHTKDISVFSFKLYTYFVKYYIIYLFYINNLMRCQFNLANK